LITCAWIETSSAETGSSQTMNFGLEADLEQQVGDALLAFAGGGGELVDDEGFAEDRADRHARIERGERVLEHDLDVAPHRPQVVAAKTKHVPTVEDDFAFARFDQAHHAARGGGFAAAGFADQAERLASFHRKGDAVHRMDPRDLARQQPALDGKMLLETGDAQQRFAAFRLADRKLVHGTAPRWQAMR
jgi:hypothetical protein